jgi:hypothetical protein
MLNWHVFVLSNMKKALLIYLFWNVKQTFVMHAYFESIPYEPFQAFLQSLVKPS